MWLIQDNVNWHQCQNILWPYTVRLKSPSTVARERSLWENIGLMKLIIILTHVFIIKSHTGSRCRILVSGKAAWNFPQTKSEYLSPALKTRSTTKTRSSMVNIFTQKYTADVKERTPRIRTTDWWSQTRARQHTTTTVRVRCGETFWTHCINRSVPRVTQRPFQQVI